ncbi:glycoside hydrolase family 1 protein [Amycolatopsis pigmentata]|uniref:beta-glucosidase n=1 Tax=Amycolatopsis pigmentata TaxID=450801 RepID=A0ABW5FPG4_9PSEU
MKPVSPLSDDFLWGTATSAFQAEGGRLNSNWHAYVERNGLAPYGTSADFRHRYLEDIALAVRLGLNTFRISVDWARIEPVRGEIDQRELAFYDDLVESVRGHGLRLMITLDHFVYPEWLGGWDDPATVGAFVRYAGMIVERYADQCGSWLIFNEPSVYAMLEFRFRRARVRRMYDHLVRAHRRVYDLIHRADPRAMVSSTEATANLPRAARAFADRFFLDRVLDKIDFIAIDYYYQDLGPAGLAHLARSRPWRVPYRPRGLYRVLRYYARRYRGLPLVVTENGMATDNGRPRADGWTRAAQLAASVYWLQRARDEGVPVFGYLYWSLTDNYEWGSYRPRFGLYAVDVETDPQLTRRPTEAVETFRAIIADGGVVA